jgi:general L-amino acid transport system permease protein
VDTGFPVDGAKGQEAGAFARFSWRRKRLPYKERLRISPRDFVSQALVVLVLALGFWWLTRMAGLNLADRNLNFGFDFLAHRAGFDIPFKLVAQTPNDSYGWALWVCFLNTVLAAGLGIACATILGLGLGLMRLADNWLIRNTALAIVEVVRNTPQLLQIIFWYVAVLQALPPPRAGLLLPGGAILSVRGLNLPGLNFGPHALPAALVLAVALLLAPWLWRRGRRRLTLRAVACALPVAGLALVGLSVTSIEFPALRGFNYTGGVVVPPELLAVVAGLSVYTSVFIAEIFRGSIEGVAKGQKEAAASIGLTKLQSLFLVVLPQALRIMIPQVTSQYLNLTKSTSLGAAVAYPELVQIFAGTVLNQSGRAIESMLLVMVIFLAINLLTSAFMNWYNRRVAIVER